MIEGQPDPRLRPYLPIATPTWRENRPPTGCTTIAVSKSLWDEACIAMGGEEAAIVSATPAEQFTAKALCTGGKCCSKGLADKRQPTGGTGWQDKPARCRGWEMIYSLHLENDYNANL